MQGFWIFWLVCWAQTTLCAMYSYIIILYMFRIACSALSYVSNVSVKTTCIGDVIKAHLHTVVVGRSG